jgi:hypothetical protein
MIVDGLVNLRRTNLDVSRNKQKDNAGQDAQFLIILSNLSIKKHERTLTETNVVKSLSRIAMADFGLRPTRPLL